MFCPSCGGENPNEARFCNQCGARFSAAQPASTQLGHAPAGGATPTPVEAGSGPSLSGRSQQGVESSTHNGQRPAGNSLSGNSIDLPMVGPSRRQMAVGGAIIGLFGVAAGAIVAIKTARVPEFAPVTPVGLVGEPTAVPPNSPTNSVENAPTPTPINPRTAPRAPTAPTRNGATPTPTNGPSAPTPASPTAAHAPASPHSPAAPSHVQPVAPLNGAPPAADPAGDPAPAGDPPTDNTNAPADNANPAAAPLPGDGNLIEHGPRNSQAGYHLGEETDATGTMDPSVFSFVYRRYSPQVASCYSTASRAHPVSGVIVMRVRIGTDGRVARTRVLSDTTQAPGLAQCVQTSMRAWQYPQPEGGEVEVDYPLRFGGAH